MFKFEGAFPHGHCRLPRRLAFIAIVYLPVLCLCLSYRPRAEAWSLAPDRRIERARSEPGFLAFPVYAHIPGIGSTYGAGFLDQNLWQSRTSLFGIGSYGDTSTIILGLNEIHLLTNQLIFGVTAFGTDIPFQYFNRGSKSDEQTYLYSIDKEYGLAGKLDIMFLQRRLGLEAQYSASRLQHASIIGSDGTHYNNTDNQTSASMGVTFRAVIDLTDDVNDPRSGISLQVVRDENGYFDRLHSRYYSLNYFANAYIPVFASSTFAFNAYRGSAFVYNQNTLSLSQLQSAMSLNCNGLSGTAQTACLAAQNQRAQLRLQENQYGIAGILGGPDQLRGFPYGRFIGSQSLFYGTEFRCNLLTGNHPIDLGFFRGALSLIQLAPFYELGAVSDSPQPVETAGFRSSYGIGLRVGFSGAIVRADLGYSDEGSQLTVFVGYPWDLPPF